MRRLLLAGAAALAFTTSAIAAPGDDRTTHIDQIGPWRIGMDQTHGSAHPTCYAETMFGSTILRFGFEVAPKVLFYMFVVNKQWASVVPGQHYTLTASFDSVTPVNWDGIGVRLSDGNSGVQIPFSNPNIID